MNIQNLQSCIIALAPFNAISMALSVLLERQGVRVASIFDNNKKVHGKIFRGIPIGGANEDKVKQVTIIVCSFISLKQISKQLIHLGAQNVIKYEDIIDRDCLEDMLAVFEAIKLGGDLDNINEYHRNVMFASGDLTIRAALLPKEANQGVILPLTTVVLTEACTLRCAECSHLMQYFTKPRTYDIETILNNFERLYKATTFIRVVGISGGEPLLHKNLGEIIDRLANYKNIGYIALTTNATLLPNEDFIRKISKCNNLIVRLSDYGEHSKHIDAFAEMCKKHGVRYAVLSDMTWYGGLRITEINHNFGEVQQVFRTCSTKDIILAEHNLAKCHLALFAHKLNAIPSNLPGRPSCLDVSTQDFTANRLRLYLGSDEPLQTCSICSGASRIREQVPPAEQLKEPLSYKAH